MKRRIFLVFVTSLVLLCGCSWFGPKAYDDPFTQAKDGEKFIAGGINKASYGFPVLELGKQYYLVLNTVESRFSADSKKDAYDYFHTLADYINGSTPIDRWPVTEDGMVEFAPEMSAVAPVQIKEYSYYRYKALPQKDFEEFLIQKIAQYADSRAAQRQETD